MQQQRREWHSPLRWKYIDAQWARQFGQKIQPILRDLSQRRETNLGFLSFRAEVDSSVSRNPSQPVLYRLVIPPLPLPILSHFLKLTKNHPPPPKVVPPHPTKKKNITVIIYYVDLYTPPTQYQYLKAYFRLLTILLNLPGLPTFTPYATGSTGCGASMVSGTVASWWRKNTKGRPWFFETRKSLQPVMKCHEIMGNVNNCRHISQPSQQKIHWCCHVFCVRFLMLKRFCLRPVTWRENFLNRFAWICPSSHLLQQKIEGGRKRSSV